MSRQRRLVEPTCQTTMRRSERPPRDEIDIRGDFEERAAIREYEGGSRREFAEYRAAVEVIKDLKPQQPPQWLVAIARREHDQEKLF